MRVARRGDEMRVVAIEVVQRQLSSRADAQVLSARNNLRVAVVSVRYVCAVSQARRSDHTGFRVISTIGKTLAALLAVGVVAALAGKGTLATVLLVVGAVGAASGLLAEECMKELERRRERLAIKEESDAAVAEQERSLAAALRVNVCAAHSLRLDTTGVDAVDPDVLGRALRIEGVQLPYVTREVDVRLRGHLARARDGFGPALVCLYGPSKAGKTRSMFEAVRAELPDALVIMPNRTRRNLELILQSDVLPRKAAEHSGRTLVLWLDDLEGFVSLGDAGLDVQRLENLTERTPSLVIVATAGGRGLDVSEGAGAQLHQPLNDLLARGVRENLLASLATAAERESLATIVPPDLAGDMERGLGAVAVSGTQLVQILLSERHPHAGHGRRCPEGAAVTWAAITATRLGFTDPTPQDLLRKLFACYHGKTSDQSFRDGLQWATTPLYADVALLGVHDADIVPYDYVVQHAPWQHPDKERACWTVLSATADPDTHFHLGGAAYLRGWMDDALEAFRRAGDRGHASASFNLGVMLHERGDRVGAEAAWRQAGEGGDSAGAYSLGALLKERGDLDAAQAAWCRADERGERLAGPRLAMLRRERGDLRGAEAEFVRLDDRGDPLGASGLGSLLHARGDLAGAEAAYTRADERGDPMGALFLGRMLRERADLKGAEAAFERADERGNAHASYELGVALSERGDLARAEAAFRRAHKRGDQRAESALGVVLGRLGDLGSAERALRRADEEGSPRAAANLGHLLGKRGDPDAAEAAYRRADERGDGLGASNLGAILYARGDLDGAEAAWRRADERGHPAGATGLGAMLHQRGDPDAAEAAYRRADERGDGLGASNLGAILYARGDLDGAEAAWRRADERGHPAGATGLGAMLRQRGDIEGALAAHRRADERGDRDGTYNLGALLAEFGDADGAEDAYRRGDARGSPEAAHSLGVLLETRGDDQGAESAFRRADQRGHGCAAVHVGILLENRGDIDGAYAAYRRAEARAFPDGTFRLGILLRNRGDYDAAQAVLRRAAQSSDTAVAAKANAALGRPGRTLKG